MTAPFAALEARVNTAVLAHLANATADFGDGWVVDGFFQMPFADSFGLIANDKPAFKSGAAALAFVVVDATLSINGTSYTVASVQQDGGGMTTLSLK